MAEKELTWKATFLGAFILFLIGVVCATSLSYASASMASITAGLSGPFDCHFDRESDNAVITRKIICNETTFVQLQDCVYIFVSYTPEGSMNATVGIKLAPYYRYSHPPARSTMRTYINENDDEEDLGQCSAEYCGDYRFKFPNGTYRYTPDVVDKTNAAEQDNNGTFSCYLNPRDPKQGAFLYLNDPAGLKKPDKRIFRYYEGWVMLVTPGVVGGLIFLYVCIIFIQIQFGKEDIKKPKKSFVAPGQASAHESIIDGDSDNEDSPPLPDTKLV